VAGARRVAPGSWQGPCRLTLIDPGLDVAPQSVPPSHPTTHTPASPPSCSCWAGARTRERTSSHLRHDAEPRAPPACPVPPRAAHSYSLSLSCSAAVLSCACCHHRSLSSASSPTSTRLGAAACSGIAPCRQLPLPPPPRPLPTQLLPPPRHPLVHPLPLHRAPQNNTTSPCAHYRDVTAPRTSRRPKRIAAPSHNKRLPTPISQQRRAQVSRLRPAARAGRAAVRAGPPRPRAGLAAQPSPAHGRTVARPNQAPGPRSSRRMVLSTRATRAHPRDARSPACERAPTRAPRIGRCPAARAPLQDDQVPRRPRGRRRQGPPRGRRARRDHGAGGASPPAREVRATHHGRLRAPTTLLAPRPPPRSAPQRGAATREAKGVE